METKLIDNWNRQYSFYEDFAGKDGAADLRLKSFLLFNERQLFFSSKSSFDFYNRIAKHHLFEAKLLNEKRNIQFQIDSEGEFDSDAEVLISKKSDFKLYSYFKGDLKQGPHSRIFNTNLRLSLHHKKLFCVNFGVNDWDPIVGSPKTAELGATIGIQDDTATQKYFISTLFSFSTKTNNLSRFTASIKSEKPGYQGLYYISNPVDKENINDGYFNYSFVKDVNDKIKIGGTITHKFLERNTKFDFITRISGEQITLQTQVSSNHELKLSVSSYISDSGKVEFISTHKPSGNHIGLSFEYSKI